MENRSDIDPRACEPEWGIRFRCIACPEVVTIGDEDTPERHAAWHGEMVTTYGWTETPRGLVCSVCFADVDPPARGNDV